jgi:hypothetical protein
MSETVPAAAEPTAAEIEAAAPHLMPGSDGSAAGEKFARAIARGSARRALAAALPLFRERIAQEIEAESIPRAVGDEHAYNDGIRDAARIARGRP